MHHKLFILPLFLLIVSACVPTPSGTVLPEPLANFNLVFSDEFNYSGEPDPNKWDYETGFIRNQEPQWYQKENANVENGYLIINTKKETKANPNYNPNSTDWRFNRANAQYTSASVVSRGKFEFKFGKAEIRCKINTAQGQWPAFWLLGVNRAVEGWPKCGEIDVMEYYRGLMHANLAWEGADGTASWSSKQHLISKFNNWDSFHTWTLDWDADYIRIFMDNQLLNETKITNIKNAIKGNNPFHEPFFMVINAALGQANETIPDNTLPSQYIIDYVRVYERKQ